MNKGELIKSIAQKTGTTEKQAEAFYSALLTTINETMMQGEKIQLLGFGTFELKDKPSRMGINPKTKEKINIAACKAPSFKASASYKALFNK
jgi:DNA-binding protein HU-beta